MSPKPPRMVKTQIITGFLGLTALAAHAMAEEAASPSAQGELLGAALKMFGALLLIVGGMLLAQYYLKKLAAKKQGPHGPTDIRIIASRRLGPKTTLMVVGVGRKVLTLGLGPETVTLLDQAGPEDFEPRTDGFASQLAQADKDAKKEGHKL